MIPNPSGIHCDLLRGQVYHANKQISRFFNHDIFIVNRIFLKNFTSSFWCTAPVIIYWYIRVCTRTELLTGYNDFTQNMINSIPNKRAWRTCKYAYCKFIMYKFCIHPCCRHSDLMRKTAPVLTYRCNVASFIIRLCYLPWNTFNISSIAIKK